MRRIWFFYMLPAAVPAFGLFLPLPGWWRFLLLLVLPASLFLKRAEKPMFAGITLTFLIYLLVLTPFLTPFDPAARFSEGPLHLMGLDTLGRDLYSRLLTAHLNSVTVAAAGSALACVIGIVVGGLLSFGGRIVRRLAATMIQAYLSIPVIIYYLLALAFLPAGSNTLILLFGLTFWPELARLLQVRIDELRKADFVQAARLRGMGESGIFLREILPNLYGLVQVHFLIALASSFVMESALSYLGLGQGVGVPSLGRMVDYGIKNLETQPAVFIGSVSFFLTWLLSLRALSLRLTDRREPLLVTVA
ncbi:MAG: ABC transporter permease [Acidobacteriota bacterium]|nr:ABC transporter permease [Acidobacteriota bacterium]